MGMNEITEPLEAGINMTDTNTNETATNEMNTNTNDITTNPNMTLSRTNTPDTNISDTNSSKIDPVALQTQLGKTPLQVVQHLRETRTSRDDYTPEVLVNQATNGKCEVNCQRCYRLKKKCLKEFPRCQYCIKTNNDCFYVNRKKARKNLSSLYFDHNTEKPVKFPKESEKDDKGLYPISCFRCLRYKRKCSRSIPLCESCMRSGNECIYNKTSRKFNSRRFDQLVEAATGEKLQESLRTPTPAAEPQPAEDHNHSEVQFHQVDPEKPKTNTIIAPTIVPKEAQEELINIKSFGETSLPQDFIDNFFYNYQFVYPVDKDRVTLEFAAIDFRDETIVNLRIYLVLSIGSLIHDSVNHTKHFNQYFNENILESITNSINFTDFDADNLTLVLLLTLYYVNRNDFEVSWNLVGVASRQMVKFGLYETDDQRLSEIFWSIYNLEKELSVVLEKPSQLPPDELIRTKKGTGLVEKFNEFFVLENKINNYKLALKAGVVRDLNINGLSNEIENWRISMSNLLHVQFYGSPNLQEFTTLVNLNYFYLCIEVDEMGLVKSSQFILQFLSQFFALTLHENQKTLVGLSINNLMYNRKLFRVIEYNALNLEGEKRFGYMENLLLILNLLKYMSSFLEVEELVDVCGRLREGAGVKEVREVILRMGRASV